MKLHIKDNTVRVRLSEQEIHRLVYEGYIETHTPFVSNVFTCAIQICSDEQGCELTADFKDCVLTCYVPDKMMQQWRSSDNIGFDTWMNVDNGELLHLVIEKELKNMDETTEDIYKQKLAYRHN